MIFRKMKAIVRTKEFLPTALSLLAIVIMFFLPNNFENEVYKNYFRSTARIISVDDSLIHRAGMVSYGEQICQVEILDGKFEGSITTGINMLSGKLEMDKRFSPGDKALVLINAQEGDTLSKVTLIDHYRLNLELILVVGFAVLLIALAGWLGVRAIISFFFTVLAVWKILIPLILLGYEPILVGMGVVMIVTTVIVILVFGMDRRFLSAVSGSLLGTLITALIAFYFVREFQIHGAVMNFSESLLYSGYSTINLTHIFIASIFIASSGAVMDVAVDITAAVSEVVSKKPDISKLEAIKSGMTVGRAVIGTMTTTLLLAYSGSYIALLMVFVAQGTPIVNILNLNYVSAEILHTMVGSFGLVTVVPFTALTSGFLLAKGDLFPKPTSWVAKK